MKPVWSIQDALNQNFVGAGRVGAAVTAAQMRYDQLASLGKKLTADDLEELRRMAYELRTLIEKSVEFAFGLEKSLEKRMIDRCTTCEEEVPE